MKKSTLLAAFLAFAMVFAFFSPAAAQGNLPPICTGVQLQNTSATAADQVSMNFYQLGDDDPGTADYTHPAPLPGNGSKSYYVPNVLPSTLPSARYAVVVSSNQQLNSLVNENTCDPASNNYVGASYSGVSAPDTTVYVAYVLSRAFGAQWSSALAVQNAGGSTATNVKIEFFKAGASTAAETFTNTSLAPGETWYLDLSTGEYATDALVGFNGTAKVTADQPVAAVSNYAPADGSRLLSINGDSATSQTLYATQITKHFAAGDYTSGITLYNPNGTDTPIEVQFIKSGETAPTYTKTDTIAANSSYVLYMGNIAEADLPNGFNGTAVVNVTSGTNGILGIFNFDSGVGQAGAANMVPVEDATTTLYFPQIVRTAFGGFESGWQIVNTSSSQITLSVEYWAVAADGTASLKFTDSITVGGNSALTNYVGADKFESTIGDGFNGGVVIKATGGSIVGQANFVAPYAGDGLLVYNGFTQ